MIRNGLVLRSLLFLAEATENWNWFHSIFRRLAVSVLTPLLNRFIFRDLKTRLVCRHSVVAASGFNVFRSDIDYALIFDSEPLPQILESAKKRMNFIRWLLPFVGELEIYRADEWSRKSQLNSPVILLIYFLRKIAWQTEIVRSSADPYHRAKAERAIMRMIEMAPLKYSPALVQNCARHQVREFLREFPSVNWSHQVEANSDFLGWGFGTALIPERTPHLHLTSAECLLLAAITPGGHHALKEGHSLIHKLRAIPKIQTAYSEACEAEYLLCRSVHRLNGKVDPVLQDWLHELSGRESVT